MYFSQLFPNTIIINIMGMDQYDMLVGGKYTYYELLNYRLFMIHPRITDICKKVPEQKIVSEYDKSEIIFQKEQFIFLDNSFCKYDTDMNYGSSTMIRENACEEQCEKLIKIYDDETVVASILYYYC
jgi:hypothetical protein